MSGYYVPVQLLVDAVLNRCGAVNIPPQDRIAQREHACPRCGVEPGKSCWERARGNSRRKTYQARPHAERAQLVREDHGLT